METNGRPQLVTANVGVILDDFDPRCIHSLMTRDIMQKHIHRSQTEHNPEW